jgi:hypothetical protein
MSQFIGWGGWSWPGWSAIAALGAATAAGAALWALFYFRKQAGVMLDQLTDARGQPEFDSAVIAASEATRVAAFSLRLS